jgi:hypothetical protein
MSERPKTIRDLGENCVNETRTLAESVITATKAHERAEPNAFKNVLIVKCVWEPRAECFVENGWKRSEVAMMNDPATCRHDRLADRHPCRSNVLR